ncbi:IS element ISDka2 orfB [Vulcanisaeta moutnovskia 768-28]|uniref:IS element ISDka2 orfB n=1 Tax=Vulcanisaeta moutnovskia (strain 768-28) TaxID=985053 RepID=F0QVS1_VULM7|nr:RNA-guided endonuclease TnpB family protein [Vulcanisaeta moutnovskia]ADY02095.1 IS element ISDka2 orfB [Vulcanisaeta moutnovskia 768-28]
MVKLEPDREAENKLKLLCSISSRLWNEVNYARRRQFFENKRVDLKNTYREFYGKYKALIGSVTAQQILNKNNEAWKSFFNLLKARKEGRLPPFMRSVSPPGYRKRYGSRILWVVLRNDQYKVERSKIILKGLGAIGRIEVQYKGLIHIKGKQGRMEIRYDPDSRTWYAHITFEISEKAVRGVWRKIPEAPKASLRAGIDIGINNLFAVYIGDGRAFLVNGRPLKAISYYWKARIANYQSTLNRYGLRTSRRLRIMYKKWRRQVKHYINTAVRRLAEELYNAGVSTVYIGYPKMISQNNGNFNTVQTWSYGYLLKRVSEVLEEYGVNVVFVNEAYTSSYCPFHGNKCGKRIARGLFKCTSLNRVFNADVVGAYNILVKGDTITPSPRDGIGATRPRPGVGLNPAKAGNVAPNLLAFATPRTLTL